MRLTDSTATSERKPSRSKKNPKGYYTDEAKLDVAKTYIMLGENLSMTARTCGISIRTAESWKKSKWWGDLVDQLRGKESLELSSKLQKILAMSISTVEDRLEHGDFMYDPRTGKIIRKEVSLRDAHAVFKDTMDIKNAMDRAPVEAKTQASIQETLAALAKNFEELAARQKEKPRVEVTDVIFLNEEKDN